jgi:1-acyl-sn-glycerol-3-phosphate acyltransferase
MLRTIIFFALFIPWTLFVIFTGVPLSFIKADYLHSYSRFWARVSLVFAGVRLEIFGREHLPARGPVIYMANHQSNFDILALFAGIPLQFRWLAKQELFRVPLFGLAMRRSGYIPIDRSDRRKAQQGMAEAARRIQEGTSVVIFPEGTRSPDAALLPFKKGGFILALQAQVPVVPVVIRGSNAIMPKHSRWICGGVIRVEFFPAVATAGLGPAARESLLAEVRCPIAMALQNAAAAGAAT